MENSNLTNQQQQILTDTGGDVLFADLFLRSAETAGKLPNSAKSRFYDEAKKHRRNWENRQEGLPSVMI